MTDQEKNLFDSWPKEEPRAWGAFACRYSKFACHMEKGTRDKLRTFRRGVIPKVHLCFLLAGVMLVTGCAQTDSFLQTERTRVIPDRTRVLLLPPDIELYELTAGGALEPKADWTDAARRNVEEALRQELHSRHDELVLYRPHTDDPETEYAHQQLIKLHNVVGKTILAYKVVPGRRLPTKKGRFDWGLGSGVSSFRKDTDARYGLFVTIRDSYSSGGRVALMAVVLLATGGRAMPQGGSQAGFASLVDLNTGDIVWFNRLASAYGDLRTPEDARAAIRELLTDLPL